MTAANDATGKRPRRPGALRQRFKALQRRRREAREARRAARRAEVEASAAYTLIRQIARWTDRWHIDPLIGLVLPGAGDALSAFCALPYLYVSIAKVRSLPLTLAVLANTLLDLALGLLPFFVGDAIDFFFRSNLRSYRLIVGYVEGDRHVVAGVRRRAAWMVLLIIALLALIWLLARLLAASLAWLWGALG